MASETNLSSLCGPAVNVDWITLMSDKSSESSNDNPLENTPQPAETTAVTPPLEILQHKLQFIRQSQDDNRRIIENLQNTNQQLNADASIFQWIREAQEDNRQLIEILQKYNQDLNADALQIELCIIYNSKLPE